LLHGLSEIAVRRHRAAHLPQTLVKAHEARETAQADNLLRQVKGLQAKTLQTLLEAEKQGDLRLVLLAVAQARANLELLARLVGELESQPQIVVVLASVIEIVKQHVPDFATRRLLAEELAAVLDRAAPR
jgi:hypothetical protein